MTPGSSRKFTLLDASVLIAATAVGLATARAAGWIPRIMPSGGWLRHVILAHAAARVAGALLVAWAPALVALGMLPPRDCPGRTWRRPGMVACVALTATLIVQAAPCLILIGTIGSQHALDRGSLRGMAWQADDYGGHAACAVAGAWAALLLAGRWRPDRCWLDRAGRLVGVAWVGCYALDQAILISAALVP